MNHCITSTSEAFMNNMYLPGGTAIPGGGTPGGGIPGGGTLKSIPGGGWEGMALWYFLLNIFIELIK